MRYLGLVLDGRWDFGTTSEVWPLKIRRLIGTPAAEHEGARRLLQETLRGAVHGFIRGSLSNMIAAESA